MRQLWICALFVARSMPFVQMVQHRSGCLTKTFMFVLEFPVKQPGPKMATETPYDSSPSKLGGARWNFFKPKRVPWLWSILEQNESQ